MLPWVRTAAVAGLLAVIAAAPAAAETRVALVIGNSSYATVRALPNAQNDARAIAQTLKSLGFQTVELALNQSVNTLRDTVQRFSRQAAAADMALVFYAGHGVEVGGRNYLVPVDARLKTDMDVAFETVSLDLVMQAVEPAKSLRIIVLDACRDNPFVNRMVLTQGGARGVGQGLARVDPPADTLVAYAAKAGSTALDGTGANSPFTTALLKHMPTPGLDIRLMFGRVRDTVMEITNRQQEPFVYGSIGGREIYLRPPTLAAAQANVAVPAPVPPPPAQDAELPHRAKAPAIAALPPAAPGAFFPTLTREPVRIAVAGPMTGADAALGSRLRNGAEQAVTDINATGGILGRQIVLLVGDDASNPRLVTSVANRLAGDGVKFVIGHAGSATSLAASEVYQDKGIVQITPFASNPDLTERGLWNVFRTCGRDDQQGAIAGAYIAQHHKGKKVAIVYEKRPYGQGLADEVKKALNAAAIKEVMHEAVAVGDKDLSATVARIKAAGADLVYWGGLSTEGGLLLRQMRDQGVTALVMAGDGITTDEFAALAGPGVEGTLMTYGADARKRAEAKSLLQKLRARKIEADAAMLNTYAALQVIKQAAEAVKSLEPQKVAAQMRSGQKFKTVIGDISFDRKGDVTQPGYAMYVWKRDGSGKITYAEVE